jgi:thiol:disulfide interchange protein DsbD
MFAIFASRFIHMKHPRRPHPAWLALALGLCLALAAPCAAQTPQAPEQALEQAQMLMVPAFNGYPGGTSLPLVLLLRLAPGQSLPTLAEGQKAAPTPLKMTLDAGPGVKLGRAEIPPAPPGGEGPRERALVLAHLLVEAQAEPGQRMAQATLDVPLAQGPPLKLEFSLPLNILAASERPQVTSPQMLARLGIEIELPDSPPAPAASSPATASAAVKAEPVLASSALPAAGDAFGSQEFWWLLLVVFAGGLGLNLTPCVYPLLPITVSYFGGRAEGSRAVLAMSALAYWAGMAVMYSALGVFVALSGGMLGEALTHPLVTLALAGVMVALALSMFEVWELRLPARLTRLGSANRQGVGGAFLMGLTLGILAAPCVGPFVLGLMTHVAGVGQVPYGLAVFLALSLGLGLPLTLLAFFSGSLTRMPGAGEWMIWVRRFFGVVLTLMAVHLAQPVIGEAAYRWAMALVGAAGAIYLGFMEKSGKGAFLALKKVVGVAGLLAAGLFWWQTLPAPVEHLAWRPFTPTALAEAAQAGKPAVVDFSASWCAPCRQLEAETFSDLKVQEALKDFDPIKVDVTSDPGPEAKDLMRLWRVRGVPTVAFLDRSGKMIGELTLVGFEGPDEFLARLRMALAKSGKSGASGTAGMAGTAGAAQAGK